MLCYVVLAFVFVKLRKKYPLEKRGDVYHVKGGRPVIAYMVLCPIIVGIAGLYVNGAEYFLVGFVSIFSGIIAYVIFKWVYGGLSELDPLRYPMNEKTRLAKGDISRAGYFLLLFGALLFVGSLFLTWYEGSWGEEYYKATYGSGLMSDFWLMIQVARYGGAAVTILGAVLLGIGKKKDPIVEILPKDLDTE